MHGRELQQLVDASGIKTQALYERAGLNRSHLYKILQKESVSVEEFVRITKAIGLKPGDLLENSVGQLEPDVIHIAKKLNGMKESTRARALRIVAALVDEMAGLNAASI